MVSKNTRRPVAAGYSSGRSSGNLARSGSVTANRTAVTKIACPLGQPFNLKHITRTSPLSLLPKRTHFP